MPNKKLNTQELVEIYKLYKSAREKEPEIRQAFNIAPDVPMPDLSFPVETKTKWEY